MAVIYEGFKGDAGNSVTNCGSQHLTSVSGRHGPAARWDSSFDEAPHWRLFENPGAS